MEADREDWILANEPKLAKSRLEAEADLASGKTISLDEYLEQRSKL